MATKKRELLRSIFKKIGSVTYEDLKSFFDSAVLVDEATGSGGTGPAGADGKTVLNGSGAPSSGLGANGDFYIDTTADAIYGPKTAGAWGSGTSLVGPPGSTGSTGAAGPGVPTGGSAGMILAKNSATNYDTSWVVNTAGSIAAKFLRNVAANTVTGTTSNTKLSSLLIPANTFSVGDSFDVAFRSNVNNTAAAYAQRIYLNTADSLSGAILIGLISIPTGFRNNYMLRNLLIRSTTSTVHFANTVSTSTDYAAGGFALGSANIDWTVNQYLIVSVQPGNVAETHTHFSTFITPR